MTFRKYSFSNRIIAAILSLVMVFTLIPTFAFAAEANTSGLHIIPGSKLADDATINDWMQFFGPDKMDTEFAGAVWTDKSVFAAQTDLLPGIKLNNTNNFLVALSAIAGNYTITGHATVPTDTILVLDLSGSMLSTETYGPFQNGSTVSGVNASNVTAMLDATNAAIESLMKQNVNSRVGVILYSGNTSTNQAATTSTATVLLPLGRYTGVNVGGKIQYLSIDGTENTRYIYENLGTNRRPNWQPTSQQVTYYTGDIDVKVTTGLKTEAGANVPNSSKEVVGGTYIQNGLYKAMQEFLKVTDTVVPAGNAQAGAERMPVLVLMSDGAPTIATTNYTNIGSSNTGNGGSTNDRITLLTQLTAAYVRGAIMDHYTESSDAKQDMLFLTLGLGTSSSAAATDTLYPAGSGTALTSYWNRYLAAQPGNDVQVITGSNSLTVQRNELVADMNYVDKYFYAANADEMVNSFQKIVSEIQLKASSYNTLVSGNNADLSGYITFEDELGELMEVHQIKGILMGNGKGGVVLYTGKGIAEGMTIGTLGTVNGATERGNELVNTVKERIPGLDTSMAQQLINHAYLDQQLYYENDSKWSNYIGWYADANGNYVGFWDKDSGYENAPVGAVYANKSYGYLGVAGDSDMMHVVVQVRTHLQTKHQTVFFKIPAALIPTVTYNVTLDKDDPTKVESLTREAALPMQLVFEVGLRSDLNAVNMEDKIAQHIANGGHIHKNADGTYSFYTNSWAIGNDTNGNGIPDPEEVESAVVAESHFNPAKDNGRFYFTEDTLVLDANGNVVTGNTKPAGNTYQHTRAIYNATEKTYIYMPMSAETVAKAQRNAQGQWYIPAGASYLEWSRFRFNKDENKTGTLGYTFVPAAFTNSTLGIDIYAFLGNNGTIKLAPATGIALTKKVDGVIDGVSSYTFTVSIPGQANPIVTDANGQPIEGVSVTAFENGSFDITVPADVTAYITGIPAGTNVTITEKLLGDYYVSGVAVNGVAQGATQSVQVTVPAITDAVKIATVDFTNTANGYGNLTIVKDVVHDLGPDPDVLATKVFTFRVKLSGQKITEGMTFATSADADVKVAADGTLTYMDGAPITLRNEESVTIYQIPDGTAYTVVETDIPSGFVFDSATSSTGTIEKNSTDVAAFVNRYNHNYNAVNVPLDLTIRKDLQGSPANEEIFRFALQQLLPDNSHPDQKVYEISSLATDKSVNDKSIVLQFADVGTYYYRIVEKIPDEKAPGMTYSTTNALFAVIVTDADMDGVLEVDIRAEANITAHITHADPADKETVTGITVEATFTNIYQVHSTSVSVGIHKNLINNTGVEIPLTGFRFGLYAVGADGKAAGEPIQIVTANALGDASFNIVIDQDKDLSYIIKEIVPSPAKAGMTYDNSQYLLRIEVTAAMDGQLSAVATTSLVGGESPVVFTNTYALTPAGATIPFSKTLVGRSPLDGEAYTFRLVRTDAAYNVLTGSEAYSATFTGGIGNHTIALAEGLLNKVGTYHFVLTEVAGTTAGMTYDQTVYHIAITVTDNGNGALVASAPVIHKLGASQIVSANFVNVYSVSGNGSVVIDGTKVLTGREMIAGEFRFGLYADPNGQPIQVVSNRADGSFLFSALNFTAADLAAGNGAKIYTYYVKEILPTGDLQGVTYDATVHTVTVTVSHDNAGNLVVTPSANHSGSIVINNTYAAEGVDVTIHGLKLLSGDWSAVQNKTFAFQLFEADANFRVTNTTPITAVNSETGEFSFELSFRDGQEGNHYYILREDISDAAGGVSYDATIYRVQVNITDPGTGKLSAQVSMYHPGTGNVANDPALGAPVAVFTNGYTAAGTQVTLVGNKVLTGRDQIAGEFTFSVLQDDAVVATGTNAADGTITFSPIPYTKPGTYIYTVREDAGVISGIGYDDRSFLVSVTVTDNGAGQLIASVNYSSPIVFENTYTPGASDEVILSGRKELTGRDLAEGEFEFVLRDETGATIQTVKNAADGTFSFSGITYDTAGVYTYTISEVIGTLGGITYDTAAFTATVTVTDPGDGKLVTSVQYSAPVIFHNTYTAQLVDFSFVASKRLVDITGGGRVDMDVAADLYEFLVTDSQGNVLATVKNNDSGKIAISLPYTQVGAGHSFFLSEKPGTEPGITYDPVVYKVTYDLVDNGDGTITAENITITRVKNAQGQDVSEAVNQMVFENTFRGDDAQLDLYGQKHFTGGRDLVAGEFQFVLKDENGVEIETVTNDANGRFFFQTLKFDTVGTYKLTISEVRGDDSKVTYDTTVYEMTVTVTYTNGVMEAVATVNGETVDEYGFTNIFTPDDVTVDIDVQKLMENNTEKVIGVEGFSFLLKGVNNDTELTQVSGLEGNAQFRLRFSLADVGNTYTYTLSEIRGDMAHMIYDTTVYEIAITISQDAATGALALTVTRNGEAITSSATFTNVYYEEPPKTMDCAHPALAAMMGLAAVGMLAVLVIGKKKFAE